ncbi:hypothetical protein N657DRAFT_680377 [Parathielavia appendiculata]|uniref:Uncharacterized protein n=1 Tax=Parathielavia appendiculata TaxID=2587402 RepID=A0AAN6U114_9PEZI|nr:hypothetical protein N657DRAFT_680377 [Parathielavia appendiculata]
MFKGLPIAILSGMAEQSYIVDSRAQFEPLDIDVVYTSRHPDQQGRNELGAVFSGNLDLPHGFGSNSEREVSERRVPRVLVISYDHVVYLSFCTDQAFEELPALFSGDLHVPQGPGSNSVRDVSERRLPMVLVIVKETRDREAIDDEVNDVVNSARVTAYDDQHNQNAWE